MSVQKLNDSEFSKFISSGKSVVKFGATYCAPCKLMDPVLESLSGTYSIKMAKADIMECMKASTSYKIMSVPTTIVYQDGKEIDRMIGFKDRLSLEEFIKKHL